MTWPTTVTRNQLPRRRFGWSNLTPHTIALINESDSMRTDLPPVGVLARVDEPEISRSRVRCGDSDFTMVRLRRSKRVSGLPAEQPSVAYVVPRLTASASRRADLLFPYGEIRDDRGAIVGVIALGGFGRDPLERNWMMGLTRQLRSLRKRMQGYRVESK